MKIQTNREFEKRKLKKLNQNVMCTCLAYVLLEVRLLLKKKKSGKLKNLLFKNQSLDKIFEKELDQMNLLKKPKVI